MGKTFLININCSRILPDSEATQYTMFIDSSKMSIVYELVEWIRWMFSLKSCIYLMHENSVIHELEDIQLLSELKYFQIMPCGERYCVHRKIYRTLLENLNFIVSWNDMKVHKYFLDKVNQMSQKLTQESNKSQENLSNATVHNLKSFNIETDFNNKINTEEENKLHLSENKQLEANLIDLPVIKKMHITDNCYRSAICEKSPSVMTSSFGKKTTENENILLQHDDILNLSNPSGNVKSKRISSANHKKSRPDIDPIKKEFVIDQGSIKKHTKPKAIKPFSVGEILSVLRKNLEEKNLENTFQSSALIPEEKNFGTSTAAVEDPFSVQDDVTAMRKRQRTRKRKRSRRQTSEVKGFASYDLQNEKSFSPLNITKSNFNLKPHHIRFDVEDDFNVMESEFIGAPSENELEINSKEISNTSTPTLLKNESEELVSILNGADQGASQTPVHSSSENNDAYKMGCLYVPENGITGEEEVMDAQDDPCDKVIHSSSSLENIQLNNSNHDLNDLLSLREKYRNGVVIQRF